MGKSASITISYVCLVLEVISAVFYLARPVKNLSCVINKSYIALKWRFHRNLIFNALESHQCVKHISIDEEIYHGRSVHTPQGSTQ